MKLAVRMVCGGAAAGLLTALFAVPALASTRPAVTGLSTHHGTYWGGSTVMVHGQNFIHVQQVRFGSDVADHLHVLSPTTLTVEIPYHDYGVVHVRVATSSGTSSKTSADSFTFTRPTMNSPIQGGLTAKQEQRISARVRAVHRSAHTAPRSKHWTAAMGLTALHRAESWVGLPYSWAGGGYAGPTSGVCAHNGGDYDCRIVGFDCSGLTMYAWGPYEHLVHYAQTQHTQAGRFHPSIAELVPGDLVFFSAYIPNGIGHVAIYAGGGMVIQAEESGTRVMRSMLADVIAFSGTYRGATRPMSSGRQAPGPSLSSITPQLPVTGGLVTITGSNLGTATSVSVGSTTVYSFVSRSANRLVVRLPAHRAGSAAVSVANPWGTAKRSVTYLGAPHMTVLLPAQGPITGGTTVTVVGTGLASVDRVMVGTASAQFAILPSGGLAVTMPAHAAGRVEVTLYSKYGVSGQLTYTYVAPPPVTPTPTPSSSSATPSPTGSSSGSLSTTPTSPTSPPASTSSAVGSSSTSGASTTSESTTPASSASVTAGSGTK